MAGEDATSGNGTSRDVAELLGPLARQVDGAFQVTSLVDGRPVDGHGEMLHRTSPATSQPLFSTATHASEDLEPTVAAARRAFDDGPWGSATGRDRGRVLLRAAAKLSNHAEAFAGLLVAETGKPIREARGEVEAAVNILEYFAGLARDINGRTLRDITSDMFAMTIREPAGVAGLIVPWNFPLAILCQKLPPALAAGCVAIVKPSPYTPLTALALGQLLLEEGLPPGAVNVVVGDAAVGAGLVEHPGVDIISFTGSTATARRISAAAGSRRLKRVAAEAGGKTPVLVLRDADMDRTVDGVLFSSFFNQGEVCVAGSRILVEQPLAEQFTHRLAERAGRIRLGDPYAEDTEMGPLVAPEHFERVMSLLDQGVKEGARVRVGGREVVPPPGPGGPYLAPTVVESPTPTTITQEELFGPVTAVQTFDDLNDCVMAANDTPYGLAASVWTENLDRAFEAVLRLRAGTVWVNGSTDSLPELPLGGRGDSGFEPEMGREGMEFFTDLKTVQIIHRARPAWYGGKRT